MTATGSFTHALAIGPEDVEEAAVRIASETTTTALRMIESLGLVVKCEHEQRTGSFKFRGATNAVLALRPEGVVTGSSGNHGKALVRAARSAGIAAPTVVMTEDAAPEKKEAIRRLGGRVVECPPGTEARTATAHRLADEQGLTYISSYDHALVMAGQGTVGLEIVRQWSDVQTVVVPVGGGGLLAGVATAIRAFAPGVRVVGVEPAAGDDMVRSRAAGYRVTIPVPSTVCDGVLAQTPGELTFPIVQALVDDVITVPDDDVLDCLAILLAAGLLVEPTGALAVAGARVVGTPGTVAVLSGGNISLTALQRLLVRRTDPALDRRV